MHWAFDAAKIASFTGKKTFIGHANNWKVHINYMQNIT